MQSGKNSNNQYLPSEIVMVRGYAIRNNISVQQIADRAGMKRSNVSAIISGKRNPTLTTFIRIVEAVGCRIDIEEVSSCKTC